MQVRQVGLLSDLVHREPPEGTPLELVTLEQHNKLIELVTLEQHNTLIERIAHLEEVAYILARGILQHEYAKDLSRHGTEEACKLLANELDIAAAVAIVNEARER